MTIDRVWIVGASSGIGRATAQALAQAGCRVVLTSRREKLLNELAGRLGPGARVLAADASAEDPQALVERAWQVFGGLDAAVLALGVSQRAAAADTDPQVVRSLVATNLTTPILLTGLLVRRMQEAGSGVVVAVSSLAGRVASPLRSSYAAAKHGLHGYYRSLAAELDGSRVAARLVVPGFVATDISRRALTGTGAPYDRMDQAQAAGYPPERVARAIMGALAGGRLERSCALGIKGRVALVLGTLAPGFFAHLVRKYRG